MKILFINHEFPPIGGGAATISKELFLRFQNDSNDIFLLTDNIQNNNENIIKINTGRKSNSQGSILEFIKFLLFGIFKLKFINRKFSPDIIFAFFTIPGGLLAFVNKLLYKTPYIVSIRGGDIPGFQLGKKQELIQKIAKPIIKLVCKHAEVVHVNSQRLFNLALENGIDKNQIKYIPNGINISNHNYRENNVNDKLKMLFTGRLSKQKNLDVFIEALSLIKNDYLFTIIGDGPEKEKLEKLIISKNLTLKVIIEDWKSRKELTQIYSQYNIFVLPSLDEGMSNSALEAVENQCVLLSSSNAHLQWSDEDIMNNWVVSDYQDPIAWKNCLENIYKNFDTINDISLKMKKFIMINNDWNILFEQYNQLVKKCVE